MFAISSGQFTRKLVSAVLGQGYKCSTTALPEKLSSASAQEDLDADAKSKKAISYPKLFCALNEAYDDFLHQRNNREKWRDFWYENIAKRYQTAEFAGEEDDDDSAELYGEGPSSKGTKASVYEQMLKAIEQGDSLRRRRRYHGAILLAHDKAMEFLDEYKMAGEEITVDDIYFLCNIAKNVKEPRILAPLIDIEHYLPRRDKTIANIYEILALLYGQKRDIENLKRICEVLLSRKRPLHEFRHALHRIRHFLRCANVVAPPKLLRAIAINDPSVRP